MTQMTQMGADPPPAWARRRRLPAVPEVSPGCHGRAPQEARQRRPGLEPMLELCPIPALPVHPRLRLFLYLCNL